MSAARKSPPDTGGFSEDAHGISTPLPDHQGHRDRLRKRFIESGQEAMPDYELLEMVLFAVFRRKDTKPLAKALIRRFGTFSEVISAPRERLLEVKGAGESVVNHFAVIRAASVRLARGNVFNRPVLDNWNAIIDYCHADMAFLETERFRILFLDKKNQLIADEVQQQGTVDHTPVYTREVIKRALDLAASAIILVHNHPSGDPTPSMADVDMTKRIITAGEKLGVLVHDHIVIARKGHVSFRNLGLM
jgi:DNA repair protein RadC